MLLYMILIIVGIFMVCVGSFRAFGVNEQNIDKYIKNRKGKTVEESLKTNKIFSLILMVIGIINILNGTLSLCFR